MRPEILGGRYYASGGRGDCIYRLPPRPPFPWIVMLERRAMERRGDTLWLRFVIGSYCWRLGESMVCSRVLALRYPLRALHRSLSGLWLSPRDARWASSRQAWSSWRQTGRERGVRVTCIDGRPRSFLREGVRASSPCSSDARSLGTKLVLVMDAGLQARRGCSLGFTVVVLGFKLCFGWRALSVCAGRCWPAAQPASTSNSARSGLVGMYSVFFFLCFFFPPTRAIVVRVTHRSVEKPGRLEE